MPKQTVIISGIRKGTNNVQRIAVNAAGYVIIVRGP